MVAGDRFKAKTCFTHHLLKLWSSLPEEIENLRSLHEFKKRLSLGKFVLEKPFWRYQTHTKKFIHQVLKT